MVKGVTGSLGSIKVFSSFPAQTSRLRCVSYPEQRIAYKQVDIQPNLTYALEPEKVLESDVKKLRNRQISYVKIKWKHRPLKEATWENEKDMNFPYLFDRRD